MLDKSMGTFTIFFRIFMGLQTEIIMPVGGAPLSEDAGSTLLIKLNIREKILIIGKMNNQRLFFLIIEK